MALPTGYSQLPPQVFPPAANFPLLRELARQEALSTLPEPVSLPASVHPVVPCLAVGARAPVVSTSPSVIRVVREDGKARLEVHEGALHLTCKKLVLHLEGCGSVQLAAFGKHVVLTGDTLEGRAEQLKTEANGRVVLEGHVRVHCQQEGQEATVKAERVVVDLKEDSLEVHPETHCSK